MRGLTAHLTGQVYGSGSWEGNTISNERALSSDGSHLNTGRPLSRDRASSTPRNSTPRSRTPRSRTPRSSNGERVHERVAVVTRDGRRVSGSMRTESETSLIERVVGHASRQVSYLLTYL